MWKAQSRKKWRKGTGKPQKKSVNMGRGSLREKKERVAVVCKRAGCDFLSGTSEIFWEESCKGGGFVGE